MWPGHLYSAARLGLAALLGRGALGCLGGEARPQVPIPLCGCDVLQTQHCRTGAQQAWTAPWPAWDPGLQSSGSPQVPQSSPSHPPAPQPAPFPKLKQTFLHVTFQSLQVRVLSSKAPEYFSSFRGCSSHDVLICAHHATCERAHCFNRNSKNVLLLSF